MLANSGAKVTNCFEITMQFYKKDASDVMSPASLWLMSSRYAYN